MSSIFNKNRHLSEQALQSLKDGTLPDLELLSVSEHMAECQACANAFAESFDTDELTEVPSGFADEIQTKLKTRKTNNRQFYYYTMRVVIAASIALMITFSGALNHITDINSRAAGIKPPDLSFIGTINTGLQNFSQKLLNMEDYKNEKEKR